MQKIIRNEGTRVTMYIFLSFLVIYRFYIFLILLLFKRMIKVKRVTNYRARNYRSNEIPFNEGRLILDKYYCA